MKRLATVLVWSALSAAFIGPGTVTTAARAGAGFGTSLLWAVAFSTAACLVLQEASARVTIAADRPLGQVIRERWNRPRWLPGLVLTAVILGCAAYQMGNILGAVAGVGLVLGWSPLVLTLLIGVGAGSVLLAGSVKAVARLLGIVVALMGTAFLVCAVRVGVTVPEVLQGVFVPRLPEEAGVLVLGLVGTTVVPYNLFLGSGLARGHSLADARLGLAVAIPLGGIVTMGVLVAGSGVAGEFSFAAVAEALAGQLGGWARPFFAFGLFAAGFSSAVTAPLAAALSVRGFSAGEGSSRWDDRSRRFRGTWAAVLLFGLAFGLTGIQPIPAIILAQALNGVLLPLVAVVLWIAVNDRNLMGEKLLAGVLANTLLAVSVMLTCVLGAAGLLRAFFRVLGQPAPGETRLLAIGCLLAALIAWPVSRDIKRKR